MQTTRQPYEFLVRWDQQGVLCGAHAIWRLIITDNGQMIGESLSPAEPVSVAAADGFPLQDVLPAEFWASRPG